MARKVSAFFIIALLTTVCLFSVERQCFALRSDSLTARIVRVHDGDTVSVLIGKKKERVRLIGIDAPEIGQKPWGAKAMKHLEGLLRDSGLTVTLEFDIDRRDKHGRLLAYLWTGNGKCINLQMLKDGYAALFTFPPNVKHANALREGQRYARDRGLGIWGRDGLREAPQNYRQKHPR
ncbi:MAG TPA: thermonuclease family protein [Thermodesulfovibrionales bacterium]|nr:thermonuclease family protein [Thermodesulfovibrionales bacterium]